MSREDNSKSATSIHSEEVTLIEIEPNEHGDWINKRNSSYESYIPVGDKGSSNDNSYFKPIYSRGLSSARDAWCYNSSFNVVEQNVKKLSSFYNNQREAFHHERKGKPKLKPEDFIEFDSTRITWNRGLKNDLEKNKPIRVSKKNIVLSSYRPFFKQHLYFARELNDMVYQLPKLFPQSNYENVVVCISEASVLITKHLPDLHFNGDTQAFPLYYYEERNKQTSLYLIQMMIVSLFAEME